MKKIVLPLFFILALISFTPRSYAQAANSWALKMFSECGTAMNHNFGNIALHAEAEHRFLFKNIYKEDVEILSVQSNCSCTKASFTKKVIKSKETAEIIARIDTSGKVHTGKRKVTVTLYFSKPRVAEVQFQVESFIRSDVIFEPGVVEFGSVPKGKTVTKKITLQYNGTNPDWRIIGMKKVNPGIRAEATLSSHQNTRKTYDVQITLLDNVESGNLSDLLVFTTSVNDASGNSVFIPIHGLVLSPLSVKPACLQFGVITVGQSVTKNLVIRGSTPFKIENIGISDSDVKFMTEDEENAIHVIPITYTAQSGEPSGEFQKTITVKTTLKNLEELNITAYGYIQKEEEDLTSSHLSEEGADEGAVEEVSENRPYVFPFPERFVAAYRERSVANGPALGLFKDFQPEEYLSQMAALLPPPKKEQTVLANAESSSENLDQEMEIQETEAQNVSVSAAPTSKGQEQTDESAEEMVLTSAAKSEAISGEEAASNESDETESDEIEVSENSGDKESPESSETEDASEETFALSRSESSENDEAQTIEDTVQKGDDSVSSDKLAKNSKSGREYKNQNDPRERGRFFQHGSHSSLISHPFDEKSLHHYLTEKKSAPSSSQEEIQNADEESPQMEEPQNVQKSQKNESENEADALTLQLPSVQSSEEEETVEFAQDSQEMTVAQKITETNSASTSPMNLTMGSPAKEEVFPEAQKESSALENDLLDEGWRPVIKKIPSAATSKKTAFQFRKPIF